MDFSLTKEQQDIIKAAGEFAQGELPDVAYEFDRNETFDQDLWRKACELGFVGVSKDEKLWRCSVCFLEHCLITEEFWSDDPGIGTAILSTTFGAPLSSF
jgi:acyl-CoA dehydrogenase